MRNGHPLIVGRAAIRRAIGTSSISAPAAFMVALGPGPQMSSQIGTPSLTPFEDEKPLAWSPASNTRFSSNTP